MIRGLRVSLSLHTTPAKPHRFVTALVAAERASDRASNAIEDRRPTMSRQRATGAVRGIRGRPQHRPRPRAPRRAIVTEG
jgi:hypothetical protein